MKNFKITLAAFAMLIASSVFASSDSNVPPKGEKISYEIQEMLENSGLVIEKEFSLKVMFTVTADKRISIMKIFSEDPKINRFLEERLANQKLNGEKWFTEKIYELPIRVQME